MAKRILTLDIGASSVVLAEYSAGAGGYLTLVAYGRAALPAPVDAANAEALLVPAIEGIASANGIRPGKVAVSVSSQTVFSRMAEIPARPGSDRFDQLVRYEIEQNVPFPVDEIVCDSQVLGETESGDSSVIVVAARIEQMEAIVSAVQKAGFEPEAVDVDSFAVANAVEAFTEAPEDECRIVLDVGAKTTSLVIREGSRLYNRSITVAGNMLTKEIAQALGCPFDEAEEIKTAKGYVSSGGVSEDDDPVRDTVSKVCRTVMTKLNAEISRSINFYRGQQGGGAPRRMYLSGGTSLLPGMAEFFASSLGVETVRINPFDAIAAGPAVDETKLSADVAFLVPTTGLALRGMKMADISVNLLPQSVVDARVESRRVWFVAAGCAAFVAAFVCALLGMQHDKDVVEERSLAAEERLRALQTMAGKIRARETEFSAAMTNAVELKSLMLRRSLAVARLNAVRQAIGDDLWIERWDGDRVTIRGWRDRVVSFTEYVASKKENGKVQPASEIVAERLKANPAVDAESVKVVEAKYIGKGDSIEQFVVEIKFK